MAVPPFLAEELPTNVRSLVPHLERRGGRHIFVRPNQELAGATRLPTEIEVGIHDLDRTIFGNCMADAVPSWMPAGRLAEMNRDGVVAEVLIAEAGISTLADVTAEASWARLCNDWLSDTYEA